MKLNLMYPPLFIIFLLLFSCNSNQNENKASEQLKSQQERENFTYNEQETLISQVDIVRLADKKIIPSKSQSNSIALSNESFSTLYKPSQIFYITSKNDTTIICAEGTKIYIMPNSFETVNGRTFDFDSLRIEVQEYYKMSDIILARLSTISEDGILETGGMLNIKAYSGVEECQLKNESTIEISFPRNKEKEGMQLYTGNVDANGQMNWDLQSDRFNQNFGYSYSFYDLVDSAYFENNYSKFFTQKTICTGQIMVAIKLNKDGKLSDFRIYKGLNKVCDEEVLNFFKSVPAVKKEKMKTNKLNLYYIIPLELENMSSENNFNSLEERKINLTDSNIDQTSLQDIGYYVFQSSSLGWINCDRLWKDISQPKVNFTMDLGESENINLNIVFHRYKSLYSAFKKLNTNYRFDKLPEGEKVTIVAIKRIDGKSYLAMKDATITNEVVRGFAFREVTMETLKKEIDQLNSLSE
ncbi:MAG: hypothetical protein HYZ42_11125 [Bacteroidetes bacterium]|nr:hypothetical protein [Bacteroidota bacterium]